MSCPIGYTGNNDSAVSIDGVLYPNESFTPPNRMWEKVAGQNNGDDFECIIPTVMKQDELSVTSFLLETDFVALEALLASREVVPVITQTMTHVISATPYFRREAYDGFVSGVTHSAVANSELVKVDWKVQPTSQIVVTSTTTNLLD